MRVAVVIPTYNGRHLLETCLPALVRQTHAELEIVVVDNGSSDDTVEWLAERYPAVRVIALESNRGFAPACNVGIAATTTPYVALLNNDTEPELTWLGELVGELERYPDAGMAASKLLLFDRRDHLHSAGDFLTLAGLPGNRGVWQLDHGQFDDAASQWVFGACAGAALYRRSMLAEVGLFDEDFGSYCEDVDLNLRAQLAGYRCRFVPTARVYHMVSATGGGRRASYYCGRNFIAVIAKDFPTALLRRHWRSIFAAQARIALEALRNVRGEAARARLRGQLAGLMALPRFLAKRAGVQAQRRVELDYLEKLLRQDEALAG